MAINERLIHTAAAAAAGGGTGNQEEGLILHLDANDVDSYDGDGSVWYDIKDHEYTPATDVSEHFNTVLYTGDGSSSGQPITGVGFQSDLVWIKSRETVSNSTGGSNMLIDSLRPLDESLRTEGTGTPIPYGLTSLDIDGFTLEDNYLYLNQSGIDYVAWCFKAGGAAVSNTDGDIASNVSVNNDLGFSIVSYTGNSSYGQTVGHGMDVAPELIIFKNLDNARNWRTYVKSIGANNYLNLDDSAGSADYSSFNDTHSTATVFSTTDSVADRATNFNGDDFIAYCFASKRGVSKVGSYQGTGSSGNKIYTGFEPAFVLMKKTSTSGGSWLIVDNKREESNGNLSELFADTNSAESGTGYDIDFNTDGFTLNTTTGNANTNGVQYMYLAFAKSTKETQLTPKKGDFVAEDTVTTGAELELDANDYSGSGNWLNTGDSDGNGVINGASYTNDGTSDYFTFNGSSDYVSVEDSTDNDYGLPSHTGTIEAWVNINSLSSENPIVNKRDTGNPGNRHFIFTVPTDGNVDFIAYNSDANSQTVTSNTSLSTGRWYHVAVTLSTDNISIYIDGKLDAQASATYSTIQDDGADLDIGRRGKNSGYHYFNGKISQVRIYDTKLTSSKIKANYDATYGLYQYADLKLHLDAGDDSSYSGSGSTWSDLANSNDGTISGASYDKELGNSFDFDGSNDIITTSYDMPASGAKTIEIWFNASSTQNTSYPAVLGGANESLWVAGNITSTYSDESIYWYNNPSQLGLIIREGHNKYADNKWHHLVIVDTGSSHKMYVDGNEKSFTYGYGSASARLHFDNLHIGRGYSATDNFFTGKVGQLRIYSEGLTADQVKQNFNFTKNDYPNGFDASDVGAYGPSFSADHFQFDRVSATNGDQMAFGSNINDVLKNLNEYTFTAWYYPDNLSGRNTIFGVGHTTSNNVWALFRVRDNGNAEYSLNDSGTAKGATFAGASGTNDQWNFIAFTVTATGEATCRVNGTSYSPIYNSGSDVRKFDDLAFNIVTLGSFDRGSLGQFYDPFNGRIGQIRLYNKALTNDEIDTIEALGR